MALMYGFSHNFCGFKKIVYIGWFFEVMIVQKIPIVLKNHLKFKYFDIFLSHFFFNLLFLPVFYFSLCSREKL